jgi:hypothetical protein
MSPTKAVLLIVGFVLLHEAHAIWAMMEGYGLTPELAYTASADLSAKDGTYALVADLTNGLGMLLLCLVLHSYATGGVRLAALFVSLYMATQCVYLVADPHRCDTLTSEVATMVASIWLTVAIEAARRNLAPIPRIRTHP